MSLSNKPQKLKHLSEPGVVAGSEKGEMITSTAWFRIHIGIVLCLVGSGMAVLPLLYLFKAERIYEATARIQIDAEMDTPLKVDNLPSPNILRIQSESSYLQTHCKNLTSRSLLESVVNKLRLRDDIRYAKRMNLVEGLANDIKIVPIDQSNLIDIKVLHPDPVKAADIANTLVAIFMDRNLDRKSKASLEVLCRLKTEMESEERKVTEMDADLERYRSRMKFLPATVERNPIADELMRARGTHLDLRSRSRKAEAMIAALAQHTSNGKALASFPAIPASPHLRQPRLDVLRLECELVEARKTQSEDHPSVREGAAKLAVAQDLLARTAETEAAVLRASAEMAKQEVAEAANKVGDWEEELSSWRKAKAEYDVLAERLLVAKGIYHEILAKMKEADISSRHKNQNIVLIDPAVPPLRMASPRVLPFVAVSFFSVWVALAGVVWVLIAFTKKSPPLLANM